MKNGIILTVLLGSISLASAQGLFTATLDGAQDGGGARQGSGFINLTLVGDTLTLSGSFSGITTPSTLAHIHGPAPAGIATGILYNLGGSVVPLGVTSGSINGSVTLVTMSIPGYANYTVAQQVADLNNSMFYVNIHNSTFTGGEIRGQIVPVPEPSMWAFLGLGALAAVLRVRRRI